MYCIQKSLTIELQQCPKYFEILPWKVEINNFLIYVWYNSWRRMSYLYTLLYYCVLYNCINPPFCCLKGDAEIVIFYTYFTKICWTECWYKQTYLQFCRGLCSTSSVMSVTSVLVWFLCLLVCLALQKAAIEMWEVVWCRWHSRYLPPHYLQPPLFHLAVKWRNVFKASSSFTGMLTTSPYTDVSLCVSSASVCLMSERLLCASWVTACYCSWRTLLLDKYLAWSHIFTSQTQKEEEKIKERKTERKRLIGGGYVSKDFWLKKRYLRNYRGNLLPKKAMKQKKKL